MPAITCYRCGEEKEQLSRPPFVKFSQEIYEHICADCWQEWMAQSVNIINHSGLNLGDPRDGVLLQQEMRRFLKLPELNPS